MTAGLDRNTAVGMAEAAVAVGCDRVLARLMVSELDIWRAANLLIRQHGSDAELEAPRLADLMLDRGDSEGQLVWARIRRAIEALRAPPAGSLH